MLHKKKKVLQVFGFGYKKYISRASNTRLSYSNLSRARTTVIRWLISYLIYLTRRSTNTSVYRTNILFWELKTFAKAEESGALPPTSNSSQNVY